MWFRVHRLELNFRAVCLVFLRALEGNSRVLVEVIGAMPTAGSADNDNCHCFT